MCDFKMKPIISFKYSDWSDEFKNNLRIRLAIFSHLELDKEPGPIFDKSSRQYPKVILFEMLKKYYWFLLNKFLSISDIEQSMDSNWPREIFNSN